MTHPVRLAVFASGGGTNLQALFDHFHSSPSPAARVELVVGSRLGIGALARADAAGVPSIVIDAKVEVEGERGIANAITSALARHRIDLIVLAGYLKLVPLEVVQQYEGRMVNIHPALLPAFGGPGMYGMRVHRAVIESGARVTGATVHLVGQHYDEGPILAQSPVPVLAGDTAERLAARVLRVEHLLLPAAIEALLASGGSSRPGPVRANGESVARGDANEIFEFIDGVTPKVGSVRRLNS